VTFVSLACSGASIEDGLLGPYAGIEPQDDKIPAQLDELTRLICARESCNDPASRRIDALLISIGANDIGFSNILLDCVQLGHSCGHTSALELRYYLDMLPGKYARVADIISEKMRPLFTFITEYPNPLRDDKGDICDDSLLGISSDEATWAEERVVKQLNEAVRTAAGQHGWAYVGGIAERFHTHGYCADDHWIVQLKESYERQGDKYGTMHPDVAGQAVYQDQLVEAITSRMRPWRGVPPVASATPSNGGTP
jgi:hypothetical protein